MGLKAGTAHLISVGNNRPRFRFVCVVVPQVVIGRLSDTH